MNRTETYIARYIGNFFSVYLRAEKGCSPHTVRSYANALSSYIDFIETTQHIRSERITTAYVTKKLVLEYLSWLEDKKNVSISGLPLSTRYADTCNVLMCLILTDGRMC